MRDSALVAQSRPDYILHLCQRVRFSSRAKKKRVMPTQTDGWCLRQSFVHILCVNVSAVTFAAAATAEHKKLQVFKYD